METKKVNEYHLKASALVSVCGSQECRCMKCSLLCANKKKRQRQSRPGMKTGASDEYIIGNL